MQKGQLFTVSSNKRIGDRSYIDEIWRVLAVNETQVWAKSEYGKFWAKGGVGKGAPRCFVKSEYDFFLCEEDMLQELRTGKAKIIAIKK